MVKHEPVVGGLFFFSKELHTGHTTDKRLIKTCKHWDARQNLGSKMHKLTRDPTH